MKIEVVPVARAKDGGLRYEIRENGRRISRKRLDAFLRWSRKASAGVEQK